MVAASVCWLPSPYGVLLFFFHAAHGVAGGRCRSTSLNCDGWVDDVVFSSARPLDIIKAICEF